MTGTCPKCDQSDGSIRCKICTFWWHPTCGGLGREEYELFQRLAELGNTDMWQCLTCKVGMADMGLRWEQTGKIVAENTAKLEKLEARVEREESKSDKLENDLKKTKEELHYLKISITMVKEDVMKMSLAEINERENNRNNVIIHQVQESTSNEPQERQYHDQERFRIILRELGLLGVMNTESDEGIKFVSRIGERKKQEVRPMKVGFMFHSQKEKLMESARYLNRIPDLQHISISNDLTEMQREEENMMWMKAGEQNTAPTSEMQEKGLVAKVVGLRGKKRIILAPLKRTEEVDKEGRVRQRVGSRRREGVEGRGQEQGRRVSHGASGEPTSGANREPLGRKEQGNWQGAAGGRSRRQEQEEQLRQGRDERKRTDNRSSQFSGSGEEEEQGRREREKEKGSSSLLLPRMSTPVAGSKTAPSGSK